MRGSPEPLCEAYLAMEPVTKDDMTFASVVVLAVRWRLHAHVRLGSQPSCRRLDVGVSFE